MLSAKATLSEFSFSNRSWGTASVRLRIFFNDALEKNQRVKAKLIL